MCPDVNPRWHIKSSLDPERSELGYVLKGSVIAGRHKGRRCLVPATANVLAPMLTTKTGLVLQSTYFPMKLFRQECGSNFLQSRVTSPTF